MQSQDFYCIISFTSIILPLYFIYHVTCFILHMKSSNDNMDRFLKAKLLHFYSEFHQHKKSEAVLTKIPDTEFFKINK